jgi:hypothetical protein
MMPNGYVRPRSTMKLNKAERTKLILDNFEHYRSLATTEENLLSQKIPRDAFKDVLDRMGALLIQEAKKLADEPGPVREFLDANIPPPSLAALLPSEFRAFCLVLNAAKVWVSAEQQATDRYLLGGQARPELRAVTDTCIITSQRFAEVGCQLHHRVRDGRPPIPLSPDGHQALEGQGATKRPAPIGSAANGDGTNRSTGSMSAESASALAQIKAIKERSNRSYSNLRKGCLDQMGVSVIHGTPKVRASSRSCFVIWCISGSTRIRSREPGPLWFRLQAPRAPPVFVFARSAPSGAWRSNP